jgi:hypothetical protein
VPLRNTVEEERGIDRLADPDERDRLTLAVFEAEQERGGPLVRRRALEDDRRSQDLAVLRDSPAEADPEAEPVVMEVAS